MTAILIATTNPGKLREIRHVLSRVPLEWVTLEDIPSLLEPEETGRTFAENAHLKATYYAAASGLPTVAEDSGLVIDALGGRPGVLSARFPGETYPDKFRGLYRELAPYSRPWSARFVCSLVCVTPQGSDSAGLPWAVGRGPWASQVLFSCEATVEGEIADAPRGTFGFGYDPIFYYPPYGCTLGEVDGDRKLAVAHRGKAFRQFSDWLTGA
ncbi:MAG TPA: non-canonical purine NTP pyrophosphatase [Vicinamibacterales bacterium]|nr:non-canonical purine NTP pyrophosphatase [Vicinamibacterales bacterium]